MLVVCHPNQKNYCVIKTKYMRSEIILMMGYRMLFLYKTGVIPTPPEVKDNFNVDWDAIRDN